MGGFCLFQRLKKKKQNLEKKNNFQSNWNKYVRVVLVKWRERKNQQQNTNQKNLF